MALVEALHAGSRLRPDDPLAADIMRQAAERIDRLEKVLRRIASMDFDGPQHLAFGWAADIAERALAGKEAK